MPFHGYTALIAGDPLRVMQDRRSA
jgi:hypothetical protein